VQEFGHHVRLATHVLFSDFVKSAGVEFYPLGGDPKLLAGCKNCLILQLFEFAKLRYLLELFTFVSLICISFFIWRKVW